MRVIARVRRAHLHTTEIARLFFDGTPEHVAVERDSAFQVGLANDDVIDFQESEWA